MAAVTTRAAAIDVGSNAIRYSVGELTPDGSLSTIHRQRKPISLGRALFGGQGKIIDGRVISQAIEALKEFSNEIASFKVDQVRAVGTSALRDAANASELIDGVRHHGLLLEVIDGYEEARLVRLAVQTAVDLSGKTAAILDIGGGSAEFSILKNNQVLFSTSERVGTVRLLKSLGSDQQNSTERFRKRIERLLEALQQKVSESVRSMPIDIFAGTGGNVEELGQLRARLWPGKNAKRFKLNELEQMIDLLEPLSVEERQKKFGFRPDRADVIFPASLILYHVMSRLGVEKVHAPGVGLKDGILIDLLKATKIS